MPSVLTKTKPKADIYATVTDKIIAALEEGTVPWSTPWNPAIGLPLSMSTRKPYRGVNILLLGIEAQLKGYESPFWGTYKKIAELGGQVRKGEKATFVVFWKTGSREQLNAASGKVENKRWAMLRHFMVFNAAQADGLPERFNLAPGGIDHDPIDDAQAILDGYVGLPGGPKFTNAAGGGAYYMPSLDEIVLPPLQAFTEAEGYYSTAFHEATHSTGHRSRLKREGVTEGHRFGDEVYSKEELIAEMGAAMLCGTIGLEKVVLDRSAAYIQSWINTLKGDSKLVVAAAGSAQKAVDLILGTKFDDEVSEPGDTTA